MGSYGKLVRDNIPDIIISNDERPITRKLDEDEYKKELLKKLVEESNEAFEAIDDRNELIKEVLRDYRFIEASGLGVPRKIIKGMLEHNGKYPDLIEEEDRFIVRLWK